MAFRRVARAAMSAAILLAVALPAAAAPEAPRAFAMPAAAQVPAQVVPAAAQVATTLPAQQAMPAGAQVAAPGRLARVRLPPVPRAAPGDGEIFTFPLPPPVVVVHPFQPPPTRYGPGHRGADLAGSAGSPVRAAGSGTVVYAGPLAGRGVVSVQHAGGLRTTYEPVRASVRAGDHVARGDVLGTLEPGHGPCAPQACLHLGARMPDRVYLDPMALFGPWRVRLKPWDGLGP